MSLRIGFDMDGVLADMESALIRESETLFGEAMTRRLQEPGETPAAADDRADSGSRPAAEAAANVPQSTRLHMTSRQTRKLWKHVETIDGFWQKLEEIEPGAVARLAAIAADRRWEVIFLTKRPETAGPLAQVQTQRWLEAHGYTLPSVFVVQGSRGRIAAALDLDFVVDDRPENCLDVVVDSKARAILVWRDDQKLLPGAARRLGIGVVKSVGECLDILTQVDSVTQEEQPGMMERVMRLLGLKEPAGA